MKGTVRMIKLNILQIFRKRKLKSSLNNEYLLLSKKDIEKLLNGGTISFEVEQYVPALLVCTEEHYDQLMSNVKEYKYD